MVDNVLYLLQQIKKEVQTTETDIKKILVLG